MQKVYHSLIAHEIYEDRNRKPEMMIALSDFWLLHGFKTKSQILATLNARLFATFG